MSWWSRLANLARGDRLNRELDEELEAHIEDAIASGRDPAEARRALGSPLRLREESRDVKLVAWIDSLRDDAIYGWRQIRKNAVTSAAAILSLALAIGACTAAFRMIDAVLLRPLRVTAPERLYSVTRQTVGEAVRIDDGCEYPLFRRMRDAVGGDAELLAIAKTRVLEVTFGSMQDTEKAKLQFVSGNMFRSFGLRPALGRLFTEDDDRTPGAHPYAVLSHDYWTRRFGQDPNVLGRTFRYNNTVFEIIGVGPASFTGTDTGDFTDLFVPTMMHPGVNAMDWSWTRIWVRMPPGGALEPVRTRMQIALRAFQTERANGFVGQTPEQRDRFINEILALNSAAAGVSDLQRAYRLSLGAIGVLVALVLLIACANVANLMTARAASRAREMALRVSIGAARRRLVQLMLMECAWLTGLAAIAGALFAWWSAPLIVDQFAPRLLLPIDWRVLAFGSLLTFGVTCLFGMGPALRASAVKPASALKGGDDPHTRHRVMYALIAGQVAFCVLVLIVTGLFVATFKRLSTRPTGFSSDRLLVVDVVSQPMQSMEIWNQVNDHLRALPGIQSVGFSGWALMDGDSWNGEVSVNGERPPETLSWFLNVSSGWLDTMQIPFVAGRDFRVADATATANAAIINETFARIFFKGEPPIGRTFEKVESAGLRTRYEVVGIVRDARYRYMREATLPVAYVAYKMADGSGTPRKYVHAAFLIRTAPNASTNADGEADPLALGPMLRQEVARARPDFRVSTVRTQASLNEYRFSRERFVAFLAMFFAIVALLLAGVGLYGVLHYSVLQRRREIGIRIALGAQAARITRDVMGKACAMVVIGLLTGLALGIASQRYLETLLYEVSASDPTMLALPAITITLATVLAAAPAVLRALRIDPVKMLRAD